MEGHRARRRPLGTVAGDGRGAQSPCRRGAARTRSAGTRRSGAKGRRASLAGRRRWPWASRSPCTSRLPDRLITGLGPRWLIPTLEGVLGASLIIANPRLTRESRRLRPVAIVLIAFVNLANVVSLAELVHELLAVSGHTAPGGRDLIYASVPIWVTNVLVFALWYWELDRGGPVARLEVRSSSARLPLPADDRARRHHAPTGRPPSSTTSSRRSPTPPPSARPTPCRSRPWAKILFMVQSLASLLTVALVVSRAVNILG